MFEGETCLRGRCVWGEGVILSETTRIITVSRQLVN